MDVTSSGPRSGLLAEFPGLADQDRSAAILGVPSAAMTAERILQTLASGLQRCPWAVGLHRTDPPTPNNDASRLPDFPDRSDDQPSKA